MNGGADDSDWLASEDISVLREILQTPEPTTAESLRPGLIWSNQQRQDTEGGGGESDGEMKGESDDEHAQGDGVDHGLMVTSLRRQVQLLQQEYDRHLEQSVARSVVKAGGKSAPRAATIKLYRNYERLARVAQALVAENQRLVELLHARQRDQDQWLQSEEPSRLRRPFQVVRDEETTQAVPPATSSPVTNQADAKEPTTHELDYSNEAIP